MKKLMLIVLAGCSLVLSPSIQTVAAHQGYTPLEDLAGTYALTFQGSFALCLTKTSPVALVPCDSPDAQVVPFTVLGVGGATFDEKGNFCISDTETDAALPLGASPPFVAAIHIAGKVTSYDPRTGTGDKSDTSYVGGKCNGATFDSTGATVASTITSHFVVSNDGKRIDGVDTSLTTPAGTLGGFSFSFTFLRQ